MGPKLTEYWAVNEGSTSLDMVWEAGKAHAREEYVSSIKTVRSGFVAQTTQLEQDEKVVIGLFTAHPSPENYSSLDKGEEGLEAPLHLVGTV